MHNHFQILQLIAVLPILLFTCCKQRLPTEVRNSLILAENNRVELQKVIDHYSESPNDDQKLKAAYFLISNMKYHASFHCKELKKFDAFFDSVGKIEGPIYSNANNKNVKMEIQLEKIYHIWNHYRDKYGPPEENYLEIRNDLKNIKAELLIENIDYAFKAWEFPWAQHLTFEQFCEYVLPYSFGNETRESWRPQYIEKYKWIADSLKDPTDPIEVCKLINRDIGSWFMFDGGFIKEYPMDISPNQLLDLKLGYCKMQASVASFAMRSMGLAVAHAQIFQWGNRNMGHDFSAVLSREGKFIDFLGGENDPGKNKFGVTPTKIYHRTFSLQEKSVLLGKVQKLNLIDVTDYYTTTSDVSIEFTFPNSDKVKHTYLCVFDNKDWTPVEYAEIKNNSATFHSMGCDVVYLPIYEPFRVASHPFILTSKGIIKYLIPDMSKKDTAYLTRKYYWDNYWADSLMLNGRFQGANMADFSDADDLYVQEEPVQPLFYNVTVNSNKKFKYARYIGPPETNSPISEISFLNLQGDEIKGSPVGSAGSYRNKGNTIQRVFDKNILTSFVGPESTGSWVGLKFNDSSTIQKIRFIGKNDGNCIEIDDKYELMFWNMSKWESLGKKVAGADTLIYNNCPHNALFLLHNKTKGKDERIFTLDKNGNQIWW